MNLVLKFLLLLSLLACSASKSEPSSLAQIGAREFGDQEQFLTFEVPTQEEQPFLLRRNSPAGSRLSDIFLGAQKGVVKIIVGGVSSEATKNAVIEAFSNHKGSILGGLEIIFVGELIDAREVAKAAKPLLATVRYLPMSSVKIEKY